MVFFLLFSWYSEREMKRALSLGIVFFGSCIVGTILFAVLFMFSCDLSMFVTGLSSSFFSLHFFLTGLLIAFPLACIISQVLFVLYLIRHHGGMLLPLIMHIVFGLMIWLLFIPVDLHLISRYGSDDISTRVSETSAGVFRKEDHGIFYYSRVSEEGLTDGIFIDTSGFLGQEGSVIPFFDVPFNNESAFPYSDIIIKNSIQPPAIVTFPLTIYGAVLTAAQYSESSGFLHWLAFASMGLALIAVFGVQFASSWKLASASSVVSTAIAIIFINYLYYMNIMPGLFKEISAKLSQVFGAKDPLIILINLFLFVLLVVFGVFMGIYRERGDGLIGD